MLNTDYKQNYIDEYESITGRPSAIWTAEELQNFVEWLKGQLDAVGSSK